MAVPKGMSPDSFGGYFGMGRQTLPLEGRYGLQGVLLGLEMVVSQNKGTPI